MKWTDSYGIFMPHWHFLIASSAARGAGYTVRESLVLGTESILHDFVDAFSGKDALAANSHGLAGLKPNRETQSYDETAQRHRRFTELAVSVGYVGGALHATEDQFAVGHRFNRWKGYGLNKETFWHIFYDWIPNDQDLVNALLADMELIKSLEREGIPCE